LLLLGGYLVAKSLAFNQLSKGRSVCFSEIELRKRGVVIEITTNKYCSLLQQVYVDNEELHKHIGHLWIKLFLKMVFSLTSAVPLFCSRICSSYNRNEVHIIIPFHFAFRYHSTCLWKQHLFWKCQHRLVNEEQVP
jgi:hypothetical protein